VWHEISGDVIVTYKPPKNAFELTHKPQKSLNEWGLQVSL